MRKRLLVLAVAMVAGPALAQLGGLPIAGGADPLAAGAFRASGGIVISDDANVYGGRGTFAPMEGLALFGDLGAIDFDIPGADLGWAVQGGGLFTLPVDLPVDLGVRGTLGMASASGDGGDVTWTTLNGGVLASKKIEMFTPYGFLGLNFSKYEYDTDGMGDFDDDETDLAIAGGAVFALNEQISFYGEIAHIDDVIFSLGGRFDF